jgi:hypothetical protein
METDQPKHSISSSLDFSDDEEFYSFESDDNETAEKLNSLPAKIDSAQTLNDTNTTEPILQKSKLVSENLVEKFPSKLSSEIHPRLTSISSTDTEVEFIVKNLDTGESFSSKLIDTRIPKGADPLSATLLKRSTAVSEESIPESKKPQTMRDPEKKKKWLSRIRRNKSESHVQYEMRPHKDEQLKTEKKEKDKDAKSKKKKLFAQVSR